MLDVAHKVIDRYSESGAYECQITGLASPSASECAGGAGSATPSGGLNPIAAAVDPTNGNLYVAAAALA